MANYPNITRVIKNSLRSGANNARTPQLGYSSVPTRDGNDVTMADIYEVGVDAQTTATDATTIATTARDGSQAAITEAEEAKALADDAVRDAEAAAAQAAAAQAAAAASAALAYSEINRIESEIRPALADLDDDLVRAAAEIAAAQSAAANASSAASIAQSTANGAATAAATAQTTADLARTEPVYVDRLLASSAAVVDLTVADKLWAKIIAARDVVADSISAGYFQSKEIVGAIIKTAASGVRLELSGNQLVATNSGSLSSGHRSVVNPQAHCFYDTNGTLALTLNKDGIESTDIDPDAQFKEVKGSVGLGRGKLKLTGPAGRYENSQEIYLSCPRGIAVSDIDANLDEWSATLTGHELNVQSYAAAQNNFKFASRTGNFRNGARKFEFTSPVLVPPPTENLSAATKKYVDDVLARTSFTPNYTGALNGFAVRGTNSALLYATGMCKWQLDYTITAARTAGQTTATELCTVPAELRPYGMQMYFTGSRGEVYRLTPQGALVIMFTPVAIPAGTTLSIRHGGYLTS